MVILVAIATLFVIGSCFGWILEVLFRRFFSQHKWMNPGFMVGPYLPLYGCGTVALYGICYIDFVSMGLPLWADVILKLVIIGVSMTLIEYITGLIFIKGMGIKLWDYSDRWGNIQGIICPLFSFFWIVVGAAFMYLINPYLVKSISWIFENQIYTFFVGIVCGMMVVDFAYSMHLGVKLSKFIKENKITAKFDEIKEGFKEKYQASNNGVKKAFGNILKSVEDKKEELKEYVEHIKTHQKVPHKWWSKKENKNDEKSE